MRANLASGASTTSSASSFSSPASSSLYAPISALAMAADVAGPGPGSQHSSSMSQHRQQQLTPDSAQHPEVRIYKLLLSGGLAGAVSRTLTAPVDRLKMIMQVHDNSKRGLSLREAMQRISSEGSIRAYFKGNGANVLKIAPETALKLTLNDALKHFISGDAERVEHITPMQRMFSGGLSGAIAQGLLYPLDTIRTRLAVSRAGVYHGIMHAARLMRRDEGLRAFYRGLAPSMIGVLPYAGVDIMLFELSKDALMDAYGDDPPHLAILTAGMLSSSIAQVVSYPLALIRTRLQAQGGGGKPVKYTGMSDVVVKTLRHEGVRGLYKGLLPNILKMAPAAGVSWYVFEETKMALGINPHT